jgi:ATP-dependent DNA helicase RecG
VTTLRGVGLERTEQLARLGIHTVEDLLLHRPRRYEDRRHFNKIGQTQLGQPATVFGHVVACGLKKFKKGMRSVFEIILEDGTGRVHCRWWNLPFMEKYFKVGDHVLAYGKLGPRKPRTIDHPETEVMESGEDISIHLDRIAPIYPLTEGLPQRWLRSLVWQALTQFGKEIPDWHQEIVGDVERASLPLRPVAIAMLHFPRETAEAELARRRLALDEFLELQLQIQKRRKKLEAKARALPCSGTNELIRKFLSQLGFQLTAAQTKVLREVRADLGGKVPMRRLLQGDVGSGKTVVSGCAALMAIESGFDVALMAPTEILAEQHFQTFRRWLAPLNVPVELLTGSVKTTDGAPGLFSQRASSARSLFVGTHALIEGAFTPEKLGLVIIDEQHKFGVAQRERLVRKGVYPHLLVMTATPIPRTLGLTLYGDLDISIIDQLPAGRGQIRTFVRTEDRLPKVWTFVREKISAGRQAYIVYPRVEDSGAGELKAVTTEVERLRKIFGANTVGLIHGRMKAEEKERTMTAFRGNQLKILVATSVIEVGVDVPNATVMIVENADRFGLAQLHQLRGRIGRGAHESYCILVTQKANAEAMERLKIMEATHDGFRIAEEDLRLRGPGELVGTQQSGMPPLRFGDFLIDVRLIERARSLVRDFLSQSQETS